MAKYIISPQNTMALSITEIGRAQEGKIKKRRIQEKRNRYLY
jgi:hypothetical protein